MRRAVKKGTTVVLDSELHPQTIAVVRARAKAMDFRVTVADLAKGLVGEDIFGIVCAQPGTTGVIRDFTEAVDGAHDRGALVTFDADSNTSGQLPVLRSVAYCCSRGNRTSRSLISRG